MMSKRPVENEYAAFYGYYIRLAVEDDVIFALANQPPELRKMFAGFSAENADFRYAADKWTIKELLGHIIDGERVFSYRALRISRGDQIPLAGFEENEYVANSSFGDYELSDLIEEFSALRQANVLFFKHLNDAAWQRVGTASEATVSVRALAFIMVGHVRHHQNVLRERYSV